MGFRDFFHRSKHPKQKSKGKEVGDDHEEHLPPTAPATASSPTERTESLPPSSSAVSPAQGSPVPEGSAVVSVKPELLWDRAYDSLGEDDPALVGAYENILSHELSGATAEVLDPEDRQNLIEQDNVERRRSQMRELVELGLKKTEKEAKTKQHAGHVSQVPLAANELISSALKGCPEAALAWTGVTFALQIIANPIKETEANRVGIEHVTRSMGWYWNLSSHLLKERDLGSGSYADLRSELEKQIMHLYQAVLSYQMKSVCSYYRNQGIVFLRDMIQLDDWNGGLKGVQDAVDNVLKCSNEYNAQQTMDFQEHSKNLLKDIHDSLEEQASLQRDYKEKEDRKCLQDLLLTDPEADMDRIEDSKGCLVEPSYAWIFGNPRFRE